MRLALRTEPKFGGDLQVEIVVDVASGHNVSAEVFSASSDKRTPNVMVKTSIRLYSIRLVLSLAQVQVVLLQIRVNMVGRVVLGSYVCIRLKHFSFLGLGRCCKGCLQKCLAEDFHL